jgi:hypothetical protein
MLKMRQLAARKNVYTGAATWRARPRISHFSTGRRA